MSVVVNRVRPGFFLDSVALMRISRSIASLEGVEDAALMMGTPANLEILAEAGLVADAGIAARGGDLVLAVRAHDAGAAAAAVAEAEARLDRPRQRPAGPDAWRSRTFRAAHKAMPDANLALVSVPGDYAAAEARKALHRGLNVMLFSDNVAVADEIALKIEARELGLLLMGPDCGTAILGGVPLAFANKVPRGDIGIIGASGTGIQEISTLIARAGGGISHAIGVGGRDLHEAVGGLSTLAALDLLDADPATRHIILVSKPPSESVVARIVQRVAHSQKASTICLIGAVPPLMPENARFAPTLYDAAGLALGRTVPDSEAEPVRPLRTRQVKGLFVGGTLCAEAQVVLLNGGEQVASNAPVPGAHGLENGASHQLTDLGADEFTRGRPHPMIDPSVREAPLKEALENPTIGLVLLDLVLGYGGADDPAGPIARVMADAPADRPVVVASVTGTDEDPQSRARQVAALREAGAIVAPSNARAAAFALASLRATAA